MSLSSHVKGGLIQELAAYAAAAMSSNEGGVFGSGCNEYIREENNYGYTDFRYGSGEYDDRSRFYRRGGYADRGGYRGYSQPFAYEGGVSGYRYRGYDQGQSGNFQDQGYSNHSDREGYGGSSGYEGGTSGYSYAGYDHGRSGDGQDRRYGNPGRGGYDNGFSAHGGYSDHSYARYGGREEQGGHGGRSTSGQHNGYDYGGGWGDRREDRGYGGEDRNDRGYGGVQDRSRGGGGGGDRGRDERGYGRQGSHSGADRRGGEDRGYGDSGSRGYDGGNRNRGEHGGQGRSGGRGGGGSQGEEGPGAGFISGTGYEQIGSPISDPRMREEWSGRAGAREVRSDDPDLHKEVQICRRPGAVRSGRTVSVNVNYFEVSVENAPREIFKYHVTVERSRDIVADARYGAADAEQKTEDAATNSAPRHEPRPERPLPRSLVGTVINATLHQYREAFESARVAHDAMASLYSPVKLSWNSKEFADVDPDNTDAARDSRLQVASSQDGNTGARVNKFQTFMVKMKLVEVISMTTLKNYYSNPIVNVLPVLQALDVVARNLATQRFVTVGSELYNMKDKLCVLNGGKEICGGYHQALHAADHRVVMNINQTVGVFYAPGSLMLLVLAVLRVRSVNDIGVLSEKQLKSLARTLRKIEVFPTHRTDRRRPICGVSALGADRTMMDWKGEMISVATYFSGCYHKLNTLRFLW